MKKTVLILISAVIAVCMIGCGDAGEHVDLSDPLEGSSIVSASDLEAFLLYGEKDTAVLAASFSMEDTMLKLTKERGSITIQGQGHTLSGTADCIIRMDDGAELTLDNVTLHSGSTAIGCTGSARIKSRGSKLIGVSDGILCADTLTIMAGSDLSCSGSNGKGIDAAELVIEDEANVSGDGVLGGIITSGSIDIGKNSVLTSITAENYNALKCGGSMDMKDGAVLNIENTGSYHGAEIYEFDIEGAVTINAKGGKEATGLFIAGLPEDIYVMGSCSPSPRIENGKGRIHFVKSPSEIPAPTSEPTQETAPDNGEGEA